MSFLDNIQTNKAGVINPFGNKTAPAKTAPAATFQKNTNAPAKAGVPSKPGMPQGKPGAAKPGTGPKPGVPKPGVKPNVLPKAEPVKEEVAIQEEIKEVAAMPVTETKVEETVAQPKEKEVKQEVKQEIKEEVKEEEKAKTSRKATSSRSKKATAQPKEEKEEKVADVVENAPGEAELIDILFKIPTTSVKYSDAIKHVTNTFIDTDWIEKKKALLEESDSIEIEADMQEGAMKKTIAKLSSLREKVWVNFIETKSLFESLSNKDVEGIIERIKFANLEGGNETARKKAGVLAVMNYTTPDGDTINLYELYDETKNRYYFLKGLMDTIAYKSSLLITMSSAIKIQKNM